MTVLDTIRAKTGPKPPTSTELKRQLETAQAQLANLEAQHGALALDALANVPGADDKLKDLEAQLSAQRSRIATLKAAHGTAGEREAAALAAHRAGLQKSQRRAAANHLSAREKAAIALSAALEEAAKQYRALIQSSEKAQAACPILTSWPNGSLCGFDAVRRLVTGEMWRVSAQPGDSDKKTLPGASFPSLETQWAPGNVTPLVDQVKKANEQITTRLNELGKSVAE